MHVQFPSAQGSFRSNTANYYKDDNINHAKLAWHYLQKHNTKTDERWKEPLQRLLHGFSIHRPCNVLQKHIYTSLVSCLLTSVLNNDLSIWCTFSPLLNNSQFHNRPQFSRNFPVLILPFTKLSLFSLNQVNFSWVIFHNHKYLFYSYIYYHMTTTILK